MQHSSKLGSRHWKKEKGGRRVTWGENEQLRVEPDAERGAGGVLDTSAVPLIAWMVTSGHPFARLPKYVRACGILPGRRNRRCAHTGACTTVGDA